MQYSTPSGVVTFQSLWRTRRDNLVPVEEMDDEHLLNTIDYLRRQPEQDGQTLPRVGTDRTTHNVEVLTRELVRRTD